MNKPLLLSLAATMVLGTNANAESMYDRIQAMEIQMKQMETELKTLKSQKNSASEEDEEESSEIVADDEEETDEADAEDSDDDEEDEEDEDDEEESVQDQLDEINESITDLNKATGGNKLKFGVDYRFAVENMQYKMANGDEHKNDAFMTNRFWLNMNWSATQNLSFHGQLAYNKSFGARSGVTPQTGAMETFDWISNENAYDDVVRVRSVYFLYKNDTFIGADMPWTFSIGRRPSTNGHLVNLRDDDHAASPMGHNINVEFDGLSSKFGLENITGIDGMYVKFCAGRGMSNAQPMFTQTGTPYATDDNTNPDIDLIGLIFVPYDNGQYSLSTQYYYANNLIDQNTTGNGFDTVGGMHAITANIKMEGIGEEWSDFTDDTTFFVSGAMSITNPKDRGAQTGMLGEKESVTGYSVWAGVQVPSLISEDGRWGLEYNWGSQYWRSMTYGEDTNIGSKLAARGNAYEAYFTEYLVEDILSLQVRYTYIDYDYAGSNGFFGNTSGNAMQIQDTMLVPNGSGGTRDISGQVVDTAQDIRFYLRYKY